MGGSDNPMNCPHCGWDITRHVRKAIKEAQAKTGAEGGSATGPTKRRDVDYAALARASHAARREKAS